MDVLSAADDVQKESIITTFA